MNTNMTGFRWFQRFLGPCTALDESGLSIGRVNTLNRRSRAPFLTHDIYQHGQRIIENVREIINPSNAKATFIQSTITQRFLKII